MPVRIATPEYYAWSCESLETAEFRKYLAEERELWAAVWRHHFYDADEHEPGYVRRTADGRVFVTQREFFSSFPQYHHEAVVNDPRFRPLHDFLEEFRHLARAFIVVGFRHALESYRRIDWRQIQQTGKTWDSWGEAVAIHAFEANTADQLNAVESAVSEGVPYAWPERFTVGRKTCQPYLFGNAFWALKRSEEFVDSTVLPLLFRETVEKERRKEERLERSYSTVANEVTESMREPIPEDVRMFVWRRDQGKCVVCGSNERLEFDHIIPVSKGGSSTERNLQLLCERCNREKSDHI